VIEETNEKVEDEAEES
jgi:hypothetical protein